MKADLHNYSFIEEDSFELNLMDESYGYSSFIDKQLSRRFTKLNGYPALESKYRHKDGSLSTVKYIIRGPVYYAVVAHHKNDHPTVRRFIESFAITPFIYPAVKERIDTSLHITVSSPVYPEPDKKGETIEGLEDLMELAYEGLDDDQDLNSNNSFGTKLIGNDTIGEKILVVHYRLPQYAFSKDSTQLWKAVNGHDLFGDSTFIVKVNKQYTLADSMRCRDIILQDTNSSRQLQVKLFYRNGHLFSIYALTDTLQNQSPFISNFFSSFKPADTLKGESLFARKTSRFFKDLFSKDSLTVKRAYKVLYQIAFDSLDVPLIKSAIDSLNWNMKDYLVLKKYFIGALGKLKDTSVATYLKQLYWKVKDTADWQSAILNALLNQRTRASFGAFKELILQEPPIVDEESGYRGTRNYVIDYAIPTPSKKPSRKMSYYGRWYQLYDTLSLTKTIFPDILQLMNIDDYRNDMMNLLVTMVDSGYLQAADYESYFPKIYLEARQLLKKQLAKENKWKLEKAGRANTPTTVYPGMDFEDETENEITEYGNKELDRYAVLLLPFRTKNPGVQTFFEQLLTTQDRRLLYNSFILLVRNNQLVPDSLFMKYAQLDKYRSELYEDLDKMKKADRFPRQYKNQLAISRSLLTKSLSGYDKIDTLVYIDKLPVTCEDKKGYVYFFKYKRMRDDVAWQLASVGMQPEKSDAIDIDNNNFTSNEDRKLENDKPVREQLQKMLKEMLYARRSSASVFYDARSYSLYRNYLSEMVKSQRYRD